ncbi:MAG: GNAT family N-acetyltransferase [Anaerolineae bacterium]|nr:GNAT family N-acetyltransferase [Anaerolineae bacterium]
MGSLNREQRQILRQIQNFVHAKALEAEAFDEQLGTVDVYFHINNPAPHLNCTMPHKGVAWIRREDLMDAFDGLARLGRTPRLVFLDALFPSAFQTQIEHMGLGVENERVVMVYQPIIGPHLDGEIPRGRLPDDIQPPVTTQIATTRADLATWLRVFHAAYYNTETLAVRPEEIEPLYTAAQEGTTVFVIGFYENTPLGAARVGIRTPTAELDAVATAPLWHGMGLEVALATTAIRAAQQQNGDTIFTIAPPEDYARLYHRLGFVEITRMLTYWRASEHEPAAQSETTMSEGENAPDEPDVV